MRGAGRHGGAGRQAKHRLLMRHLRPELRRQRAEQGSFCSTSWRLYRHDADLHALRVVADVAGQRGEMAQAAVERGRTSIRHACQTFEASKTCDRYQAKTGEENARIADWLVRRTTTYRDQGFGPCLRNAQGFGGNHGRVYRICRGAGVEPADQAEEAPGAEGGRAAGGTGDDQPGLVDGLHARSAGRRMQLPAAQRAGRLRSQERRIEVDLSLRSTRVIRLPEPRIEWQTEGDRCVNDH